MRYLLISIKDRAVNAFQPIASVRAEGEALRAFQDLIADNNSPQAKHPDDYDLYLVGYYDDQTGKIDDNDETAALPRKIADGKTIAQLLQNR